MTDYVKSTNFASKDSLSIGNPLKIVKGTEIDTEFNNIATAVATKADIANPTFTGVPAAPTAASGTNTTQLATTAFVAAAVTAYDAALTVSASQLETDAVITSKIANDAITADKILAGAVGNTELATDAVTQVKMANSSVGTAEIIDANVTAAKLSGAQSGSAPVYGARAWVNFDGTGTIGTNQTVRSSGNIASVYKNSTGDYTITFTTAMQDANYVAMVSRETLAGVTYGFAGSVLGSQLTTSCRISTVSTAGVAGDIANISVVIFR
jgi:hypothetical protein